MRYLKPFLASKAAPYLTLALWVGSLLLFRSSQQSLMAHDEGIYAVQARSMLLSGDWITPTGHQGTFAYDRAIGIQWLIASCFALFGVSEGTARLPSLIAAITATLLTYSIGCKILNQRLAWIGAAILSVTPLWTHYGRLATQDATLVFVELLGIWALLNAEERDDRQLWLALAGSTVGLGFLIKGFMIIPAAVALLPYLVVQQKRHKHLTNPWLYLGLVLGFLPALGWIGASVNRYGFLPIEQLFGKLFHLGGQTYLGAGPLFYFWNIPANAFPWPLFCLIGVGLLLFHPFFKSLGSRKVYWLLIGYPTVLFIELTLFGTKTHYYPLQLMPFMALLAAVGLDWVVGQYQQPTKQWLPKLLTWAFGILAVLLIGVGLFVNLSPTVPEILRSAKLEAETLHQYGLVALAAGLGWLILAIASFKRYHSAASCLAGWLLGSWLALAMLGITGLWGNYNPDLKTFLQQPEITAVLKANRVGFVVPSTGTTSGQRKTHLLLSFYTPLPGKESQSLDSLENSTYAWVAPGIEVAADPRYSVVDSIRDWRLVQVSKITSQS